MKPIHPEGKLRRGFYPLSSLVDKHNYKSNMRIERDGSVTESVFLFLPDQRIREEIIFLHFMQNYGRWIIQEAVGVSIMSRDSPWDFQLETSRGDSLNIEVVSIADSKNLYENNKREEALINISNRKTIPLSYLRKIARNFPDPKTDEQIRQSELSSEDENTEVENPWFSKGGSKILLSVVPSINKKLDEFIFEAIESKAKKSHTGKEKTILIIDNRTSAFDVDDFHASLISIDRFKEVSPFREVWFYTGYYSDNDGGNSECSFSPILLSGEIWDIFNKKLASDGLIPNEDGLVFTTSGNENPSE